MDRMNYYKCILYTIIIICFYYISELTAPCVEANGLVYFNYLYYYTISAARLLPITVITVLQESSYLFQTLNQELNC